jgi:hypothetical protein
MVATNTKMKMTANGFEQIAKTNMLELIQMMRPHGRRRWDSDLSNF